MKLNDNLPFLFIISKHSANKQNGTPIVLTVKTFATLKNFRLTAVRETTVSRHHACPIEDTPRNPSDHRSTIVMRGTP